MIMSRFLVLVLVFASPGLLALAVAQDEPAAPVKDDSATTADVVVPDGVIPDRIASGLVKGPVFRFALHNVAFSPDGKMLAGGSGDGMAFLWNMRLKKRTIEMKAQRVQAHNDWTFSIVWSADSEQIVTGGGDNLIHVFDWSDIANWYRQSKFTGFKGLDVAYKEKPLRTFKGHTEDVHAIALTSDGATLVSAGDDWGGTFLKSLRIELLRS